MAIARAETSVFHPTITQREPVASVSPTKIIVFAEQTADDHHREKRADAARAQEIAAGEDGIAQQVLDERRHQRHRRQQDDADQEHEDQGDREIPVAEDAQGDERTRRSQGIDEEEIEADDGKDRFDHDFARIEPTLLLSAVEHHLQRADA
jgi:hypothetical protein